MQEENPLRRGRNPIPDRDRKAFARLITQLLKATKLPQADFAALMDVSPTWVTRAKNGDYGPWPRTVFEQKLELLWREKHLSKQDFKRIQRDYGLLEAAARPAPLLHLRRMSEDLNRHTLLAPSPLPTNRSSNDAAPATVVHSGMETPIGHVSVDGMARCCCACWIASSLSTVSGSDRGKLEREDGNCWRACQREDGGNQGHTDRRGSGRRKAPLGTLLVETVHMLDAKPYGGIAICSVHLPPQRHAHRPARLKGPH